MAETIRSFISIHLPEFIRDSIAGYQSGLRKLGADIRWVRPENLHITLKFLGDIRVDQIDSVVHSMVRAAASESPFILRIGGAGYFPGERNPRIVWLSIDSETPVLTRLADSLNRDLNTLGFPSEKREFKSHLTIGRFRAPGNTDRIVRYTASNGFQSDPFRIDQLFLMRSDLKSSGAEYTVLKKIQL